MKPAKRETPKRIKVAGHERAFREIIGLIAAARRRAFQAVNTELIDLYWRVGSVMVSPLATQIRKSHHWCDKAVLHKSLSTVERIEMDARPHPGPLPQERENRLLALGVARASCGSLAVRFDEPRRGDRQFVPRITNTDQSLFPLLGGEGKGEGERQHHFLFCLP